MVLNPLPSTLPPNTQRIRTCVEWIITDNWAFFLGGVFEMVVGSALRGSKILDHTAPRDYSQTRGQTATEPRPNRRLHKVCFWPQNHTTYLSSDHNATRIAVCFDTAISHTYIRVCKQGHAASLHWLWRKAINFQKFIRPAFSPLRDNRKGDEIREIPCQTAPHRRCWTADRTKTAECCRAVRSSGH